MRAAPPLASTARGIRSRHSRAIPRNPDACSVRIRGETAEMPDIVDLATSAGSKRRQRPTVASLQGFDSRRAPPGPELEVSELEIDEPIGCATKSESKRQQSD